MKDVRILNFNNDIVASEVEWLWKPYIPYNKITIIQGDPGCGKTMLASYIISKLTNGYQLESEESIEPVVCLYQTGEDGLGDTIKPRLEMLGANCDLVYSIDDIDVPLSMGDERIGIAIEKTNAKLLVLDPIQAYLGANVDMHRANEVRPILKRLGAIAEQYNCAVILIGHMNKSSNKSTYRGVGSIDFPAFARSILLVGEVKDKQDTRAIVHDKSSLAPKGASLAFQLSDNGFEWLGEYEISADELLNGSVGKSKLLEAITLLDELVNENGILATKVFTEANNRNIGKSTIKMAKSKQNIKSIKTIDGWVWKKEK